MHQKYHCNLIVSILLDLRCVNNFVSFYSLSRGLLASVTLFNFNQFIHSIECAVHISIWIFSGVVVEPLMVFNEYVRRNFILYIYRYGFISFAYTYSCDVIRWSDYCIGYRKCMAKKCDMLPIKTHVLIHITKTQNKTRIQIRIQLVFLIYAIYVIFPQGNLKY